MLTLLYLLFLSLVDKGTVFIFGSSSFGKLGNGLSSESTEEPQSIQYFIDNNIKIKQLACGGDHILALSGNTSIRAFIILSSSYQNYWLFSFLFAIAFLTNNIKDKGQVYGWGWNEYNQLTGNATDSLSPKEIVINKEYPIKQLNAGKYAHSFALTGIVIINRNDIRLPSWYLRNLDIDVLPI